MDLISTILEPANIALNFLEKGTIACSVWWNRNQAVHDESGMPPSHVWEMANRNFQDCKEACTPSPPQQIPSATRWRPLSWGFLKINVDGAATEDSKYSSIEVIICDSQCTAIAVLNKVLPASYTAEVAEAVSLLHGALFASEMEVSHAIFESDALSLIIQSINSEDVRGEIGHILQNIKSIASSFSWCSFQHLKRDGNRVAHELAKVARDSGVSQVWKRGNSHCSGASPLRGSP